MSKVIHELEPIFDENSEVLILGTIPSPKSREIGFYYAHPQNRFWKVLGDIFEENIETIEERKDFLYRNHIALWDALSSCHIEGASDASIGKEKYNPIEKLIEKTKITTVFCTGKKAYNLYQRNIYIKTGVEAIYLPSTSPANCALTYGSLKEEYEKIKKAL